MTTSTLLAALLLTTASIATASETSQTRLGALALDHGLPTTETRRTLYDELDFQRAVQAVLWAEPAVNNWLFQRGMVKAGVPNLGAMVYNGRMHPGQETLTPNQSVVYLYDSINLTDTGPVIHVTPPDLSMPASSICGCVRSMTSARSGRTRARATES